VIGDPYQQLGARLAEPAEAAASVAGLHEHHERDLRVGLTVEADVQLDRS
jgi:hypothetical protein